MKRLLFISILIPLVLMGLADTASSQLLPFRAYSIEKGLSESVVNDLMQDDHGYLWIATGYGLNRFDGITFQNYYEENGLLNNKIYSLFEDREGTIWIGTGGGVNIMEDDSLQTIAELEPLTRSTVLEIYQDSHGEYWFATDGEGIWHYDRRGELTQYTEVHGLANNRVRDILEDGDGTLWFGTRGGLTSLSDGSFRTFTSRDGLAEDRVRDLALTPDGSLWIATRGGLSLFRGGAFENYTEAQGLINNRIQSLSPDDEGGLWLGTEQGASHFDGSEFKNYTVEQGLSNNIIYATLFDREKNIWFGTFGGGINLFFGDHLKNYSMEQGLPNNVVTSITQDQGGNHWITTYGGGLSKFDGESFETYTEQQHGLVDNKVYTAMVDHLNRLFIGTRWGLSIYDGNRFRNFDETELPYRKIRAIEQLQSHEAYWLGTYGEGVLEYRDGSFTLMQEEHGLANNTVMSVEETQNGDIWLATYGGVSRYRDGEFTNYTIRDGLPNNGVLNILESSDGRLWVSTFGGIAYFEDGEFTAITEEEGLQDEVCYFIIEDREGTFWIGTNEGIIRFDFETYRQADTREERLSTFKLITQDQGLIANEMNAGASFIDREGVLWFGSVGGVTSYNPAEAPVNDVPPKIHIQQIRVSGEPVERRRGLEVSSDNRNITIAFIGISFTAPEQVTYEYRLRGSGEGWQRTGQRTVRYSAMLPGEYTFQVRAQNSDGVWSAETSTLTFQVLAPFWLRWWFILLVLLAVGGIVYLIYNYYRVRKMMEMERMRVRIASDLHDDVGSALTEIALQSDFLQATEADDELKQSLNQIGAQSRKIVSSLDDIVWSIDARNDTLGDLTDRMQDYLNNVLPDKEVYYEFDELDMDEKLDVPMKENLYLIFKEAVNNIAKHSNADKVKVVLKNQDGKFDLYVHDNGRGTRGQRKSGQGLQNMKMRADRIDADIEFENETGFTVHVYGKGL